MESIKMSNPKIFGFSGKIGVGKNYVGEKIFGKVLYDLGYNVHILAVADQTKYEFGSRFSLIKDNFIDEMDKTFGELFVNKSADTRKKLQYYGTDYCRNGANWKIKEGFTMYNEPSIWIKGLYLQIKNILERSYNTDKDVFIISDIRFINEADFIKSLGGSVIRINAPIRNYNKMLEECLKNYTKETDVNNFIEKIKSHSSETNLDNYEFDYVINNDFNNSNDVKTDIEGILKTLTL
jgi:hypothetical protein